MDKKDVAVGKETETAVRAQKEYELQVGPWTLKTPGVYLWLECAYCDWAFGVRGLPVPPEPRPLQSHHAKVICTSCYQRLLLDSAPPWLKKPSIKPEKLAPKTVERIGIITKNDKPPRPAGAKPRKGIET